MVPDDVAAFGQEVARRLRDNLEGDLVGAYFVGSIALGGYVAGESDIDVVAVSEHPVRAGAKPRIVSAVLESAAGCPARGLEFTLYRGEVTAAPPTGADFELNLTGGPRMSRSIHLDRADEPGFWYVIDRAIAHRAGVSITGPPAGEIFADAPRGALLDAMMQSMRWHRENERATMYSVLNACRAWRFVNENELRSKLDGAAWARSRWAHPEVIDTAVALRHGESAHLQGCQVDQLLDHVQAALSEAGADGQ